MSNFALTSSPFSGGQVKRLAYGLQKYDKQRCYSDTPQRQNERLGREPLFLVRGPWILLQNRQNPGKWPRFLFIHQIFKADFSAMLTVPPLSGTDFIGRNGCFLFRRPTGQF
jgi:hypothetical protein